MNCPGKWCAVPEQLGTIPTTGSKQKFGGYTPSPPPVFSLSNHTGIECTFPLGGQLDLFYHVGAKRSVAVKCDTPTADDNYPRPKGTTQQEILIPPCSPLPFQPHAGQTTAWAPPGSEVRPPARFFLVLFKDNLKRFFW